MNPIRFRNWIQNKKYGLLGYICQICAILRKYCFCISFNILQSIYLGQIFAADVICLECTPQQVQLGIEAFAYSTVVFLPQSDSDYDQSQYGNEKWIFSLWKNSHLIFPLEWIHGI